MSGTEFLTQAICSGMAKSYDSLNVSYIATELSNLQSAVQNLQGKKADFEEISKYLINKDKEDTVEYRLVKEEIKSIDKKIKDKQDEETNLNFLKTQYETLVQQDTAEENSFKAAAKDAYAKSFDLK